MPQVIHHLFNEEEKERQKLQRKITSDFATLSTEKEINEIGVDSVIQKSEISRSTFYKCFDGMQHLSEVTAKKLVDQAVQEWLPQVVTTDDIAVRVAAKTRQGIHFSVSFPTIAKLALKINWPVPDSELIILQDIKKDVEEGIKQGRFTDVPSSLGVNLIFSTLTGTVQEMLDKKLPPEYENQAIYQMLLGLGVDASSALEISKMPLPESPPVFKKGIAGKVMKLIASRS